jgi:hypothetical protein
MATKDNDVVALAKGTAKKKTTRKPAAKKTTRKPAAKKKVATKKVVAPVLTPAEERDLKAKAMVENLLDDVQLTPNKEDAFVLDETPETPEEPKGVEWLEEQISLISQDNQRLKAENDVLLNENQQFRAGGNPVDDGVKNNVVSLFDELQQNHIKMGITPGSKVGNFRIYCPGFLDRMIVFFPFLNDFKKY